MRTEPRTAGDVLRDIIRAMGTVLTVAGVVLQLVGALVALRGLIKTHDAYAEKSIRTLSGEMAERWRARSSDYVARILRRPRNRVIGVGSAMLGVSGFRARAIVTWGPLTTDTADALRELDRRTRDLSNRMDSLDERVADNDDAAKAALKELRSDLEGAAQQADVAVRSAAIEGLMGEAVGLMLVIVGGILQAWGALIPAA
jgi:hypothetical protein